MQERAADFETWPAILYGYIKALADEQGIAYDDAMAHAIHTPEGVAAMREWTRNRTPAGETAAASPAAIGAFIERHYPEGIEGWQRRPRATKPVSLLRRIARRARRVIGRWFWWAPK